MRENVSYRLDEMENPVAFQHVQDYLEEVSSDEQPLEEEDFESDMREIPEEVLEADLLNSARAYMIGYEHLGSGPNSRVEVVEFYDVGDKIVLSGEGQYLESAREIMGSERPRVQKSKEVLRDKVDNGLKGVANRLGG